MSDNNNNSNNNDSNNNAKKNTKNFKDRHTQDYFQRCPSKGTVDIKLDNNYKNRLDYRIFREINGLDCYQLISYIDCSKCDLDELPVLPKNLEYLICSNNNLTEISELPSSLKELICYKNKITKLPDIPEHVELMMCFHNYITEMPKLPDTLKLLTINQNKITELPESWPKELENLNLEFNPISHFPKNLPDSLKILKVVNFVRSIIEPYCCGYTALYCYCQIRDLNTQGAECLKYIFKDLNFCTKTKHTTSKWRPKLSKF